MARRVINSPVNISSVHGGRTPYGYYGKHLGYDYVKGVGNKVYAPETVKIIGRYSGGAGGNYLEMRGKYTHRVMHLSKFVASAGKTYKEGSLIAYSGNTGVSTGPHVHHDVRKNGTTWNASFSNYIDWEKYIKPPAPKPPSSKMPPVGSMIQLIPVDVHSTFKAGTTKVVGKIKVTNKTFVYKVRGYDKKYPYRIIINSKSAGGDGVALALYYTNGSIIKGWKRI